MGYKPDWQNQSHAKNGQTTSKPGIVSKPIFHGEKQQSQPKLYLADGSEGGVDVNWMAGENYGDNTTAEQRVEMSGGDMAKFKSDQIAKMPELSEPKAADTGKRQSFGEAFKSAKDGSTFEWNGKQYKKEYASAPAKKSSYDVGEEADRNMARPAKTFAEDVAERKASMVKRPEPAAEESKPKTYQTRGRGAVVAVDEEPKKKGSSLLANNSGKYVPSKGVAVKKD